MPPQPKLVDRALIGLKLKKAAGGGLTREQAMQAWPVRNPALKTKLSDDGIVTIELPRRKDAIGGVLGFLFSVPESKPVQLDEVGTFVWTLCDGDHTVGDIIAALADEYKLNRREVEVSLNKYLQDLAKRGIIAFAVPRDVAEAAGLEGPTISPEPEASPAAEEQAEPVGDFHPGLPPEPAPRADDTSDLPPVEVDEVLDLHPDTPEPPSTDARADALPSTDAPTPEPPPAEPPPAASPSPEPPEQQPLS